MSSDLPKWDEFRRVLLDLLKNTLEGDDKIFKIESRTKSLEAIREKIRRKPGACSADDLTDIVGIRLVVLFEEHLDTVFDRLAALFNVREAMVYGRDNLKQQMTKVGATGRVRYHIDKEKHARIHIVALIGEDRASLPEWQKYRDLTFELQITTVFEDAWSEINHKLNYKADNLRQIEAPDIVRTFRDKLDQFDALLTKPDVHEKRDIHPFLNENHFILHPNPAEVFSEVPLGLGTEFRMDFLIREASGSYILVELENSRHKLFTKSGDFTAQVNHAQRQVEDWQQWIEENIHLVQKQYPDILSPIGMVVLGRSFDLTDRERTRLARRNANQRGRMVIQTYDDLMENAHQFVRSISNAIV